MSGVDFDGGEMSYGEARNAEAARTPATQYNAADARQRREAAAKAASPFRDVKGNSILAKPAGRLGATDRDRAFDEICEARKVPMHHRAAAKKYLQQFGSDVELDDYKRAFHDWLNPLLGPDYRYDPHLWTTEIRKAMAKVCYKWITGWAADQEIINPIMELVADDGRMGDNAYVMENFYREFEAWKELQDWRINPNAEDDMCQDTRQMFHFVQQILGNDKRNWPAKRADAVAAVLAAAQTAVKDSDGHPIAASVAPNWTAVTEGAKVVAPTAAATHWIDIPENRTRFWATSKGLAAVAGVTEDEQQRDFIHGALGHGVSSVREYNGGALDSALTLVLKESIRTLLLTKCKAENITTVFIASILKGSFETSLTALGHAGVLQKVKEYVVNAPADEDAPDSDDPADWFRESAEAQRVRQAGNAPQTPPASANAATGVTTAPPTVNAPTTPVSASTTANVLPTIQPVVYGEALCTVYPLERGSVVFKGIRFSVTFRVQGKERGTWEMAQELMEEFAAHRDMLDPSCLVQQPSAVSAPTAAMQRNDMPPMVADDDNAPTVQEVPATVKSEDGTGIMRTVEGDKVKYTIYYAAGGSESSFPLVITSPRNREMLETFLIQQGHRPEKWENGKRYGLRIKASWKQGAETPQSTPKARKYFKDFTGFALIKEAMPA